MKDRVVGFNEISLSNNIGKRAESGHWGPVYLKKLNFVRWEGDCRGRLDSAADAPADLLDVQIHANGLGTGIAAWPRHGTAARPCTLRT
jgi:hypothetical protein